MQYLMKGPVLPLSPNMVLGITGHRPNKLGGYNDATNRSTAIKAILRTIYAQSNPSCVVSGMALGVDQWAAEVALDRGINILALIPCAGQDAMWPEESKKKYAELLDRIMQAHGSVEYVSTQSYKPELQQMQKRNQAIVDCSTHIFAVWDRSWGGTGSCVRLAKKAAKPITILHPTTMRLVTLEPPDYKEPEV